MGASSAEPDAAVGIGARPASALAASGVSPPARDLPAVSVPCSQVSSARRNFTGFLYAPDLMPAKQLTAAKNAISGRVSSVPIQASFREISPETGFIPYIHRRRRKKYK